MIGELHVVRCRGEAVAVAFGKGAQRGLVPPLLADAGHSGGFEVVQHAHGIGKRQAVQFFGPVNHLKVRFQQGGPVGCGAIGQCGTGELRHFVHILRTEGGEDQITAGTQTGGTTVEKGFGMLQPLQGGAGHHGIERIGQRQLFDVALEKAHGHSGCHTLQGCRAYLRTEVVEPQLCGAEGWGPEGGESAGTATELQHLGSAAGEVGAEHDVGHAAGNAGLHHGFVRIGGGGTGKSAADQRLVHSSSFPSMRPANRRSS